MADNGNEKPKHFRNPVVLTAVGVAATLVLTAVVVIVLQQTGGAKTVSDNAALIGALVGLGGIFTNQLVNSALEDRRAQGARETEQEQRDRELALQQQRAQEDALQVYLNDMGYLLLERDMPLRQSEGHSEARTLARARTLTVLLRLDGDRKRSVLQFLYESGLIHKDWGVVSLELADLREADLSEANLSEADLSWTDLSQANLSEANLSKANLQGANLSGADLSGADLSRANLKGADLSNAVLAEADIGGADLSGANLRKAHFSEETILWDADIRGADFSETDPRTMRRHLESARGDETTRLPPGLKPDELWDGKTDEH